MFRKDLSAEHKPSANNAGTSLLQPRVQPKTENKNLPVNKFNAHLNDKDAPIRDPFIVRERMAKDHSDYGKKGFLGFKYKEHYYSMHETQFAKVPGFDHLLSLETKGQTLYFQRYFVPEIITDDTGKEIADPKLGHYYLEEMILETEIGFDFVESYHVTRSNTNVVKRVPKGEQDFWVNFRHRHLGLDIHKIIEQQIANETHFVPGSIKITSLDVTLNPESDESFNRLFTEKLLKSYPENLTLETKGISDMENFAYLATFLYEYKVFRPKIP